MTQIANPKWQNHLVFFSARALDHHEFDVGWISPGPYGFATGTRRGSAKARFLKQPGWLVGDWNIGEMYGVMMVNDG